MLHHISCGQEQHHIIADAVSSSVPDGKQWTVRAIVLLEQLTKAQVKRKSCVIIKRKCCLLCLLDKVPPRTHNRYERHAIEVQRRKEERMKEVLCRIHRFGRQA